MPEPRPAPAPDSDWTQGRLKWAIALVIAGLGLAGLGWSILLATPPRAASTDPIGLIRDADERPPGPAQVQTQVQTQTGAQTQNADQSPPPVQTFAKLIRINSAPAAELMLLPGIGEARAGLIIESRQRDGPFRIPADLERVSGIGPKTRDRIAPMISFE